VPSYPDPDLDGGHLRVVNEVAKKMGGYVASVCIGHNLDSASLKRRGASRGPHIRFRFRNRRLAEQVAALAWAGHADTKIEIYRSGDYWYASVSRIKGSRILDVKKEWWQRAIGVLTTLRRH
jgi:hypothetical protein